MKRGDYDHNHTLLSGMTATTAVLTVLSIIALGGLIVGLAILDKF